MDREWKDVPMKWESIRWIHHIRMRKKKNWMTCAVYSFISPQIYIHHKKSDTL